MNAAFALPGSIDGLPAPEGPRVRLRAPRQSDAADVYAVYSDPQVLRYWSHGPWRDPAQADDWIARSWAGFADRSALQWVVARRDDDRVVGSTTLFACVAQHRRCEIGYALGAAHWGRGLAREALALALDQAFGVLGCTGSRPISIRATSPRSGWSRRWASAAKASCARATTSAARSRTR